MRTMLAGVIILTLGAFWPAHDGMAQADDLASRAAQIVTQLSKHDFAAAEADFDSTMKAALAGEKLSEAWNGLQGQVGQYKGQKSTRAEEYAGYRLIVILAGMGAIAGIFGMSEAGAAIGGSEAGGWQSTHSSLSSTEWHSAHTRSWGLGGLGCGLSGWQVLQANPISAWSGWSM